MDKQPSPKHSDKQIQSYLQHRWFRYTVFMNELITLVTKQQLGLCSTLIYSSNTLHNDIWLWNATKLHYNSQWISSGHISEILLAKKKIHCWLSMVSHSSHQKTVTPTWNRCQIFALQQNGIDCIFFHCIFWMMFLQIVHSVTFYYDWYNIRRNFACSKFSDHSLYRNIYLPWNIPLSLNFVG